jgi:hypothetical protein
MCLKAVNQTGGVPPENHRHLDFVFKKNIEVFIPFPLTRKRNHDWAIGK